jgi:hypothetical protein
VSTFATGQARLIFPHPKADLQTPLTRRAAIQQHLPVFRAHAQLSQHPIRPDISITASSKISIKTSKADRHSLRRPIYEPLIWAFRMAKCQGKMLQSNRIHTASLSPYLGLMSAQAININRFNPPFVAPIPYQITHL